MRNAFTIARKELSIYFTTPWAYVVLTAMAFLSSYFFLNMVEEFRRAQDFARENGWDKVPPEFRNVTDGIIVNVFQFLQVLILFLAPFLSMRLFAEERKNRTFELLFTCPIRPLDMVLGKYLGGLGVLFSTLALTWIYPLLLSLFGSAESGHAVEWQTVAAAYVGVFLWGATCMAIGMFISSLTDSQMLASILTFSILLPWMLVSWLAQGAEEPWRSTLNYISFQEQLAGMIKGSIELQSLIYFASIIFLSLLLTHRSVEAQRWT